MSNITSLTIQEAKSNKEKLQGLIDREDSIEIDFALINDADLSGLQLLIALIRECEKKQKRLIMKGALSDSVQRTIQLCGLYEKDCPEAGTLLQILKAV